MDIKKLRHAVTLSEEGNFARSAEKLHITQSALSRSIQALEGELKLQLFERHSNGVRPTIAGQHILSGARDLLRRANSLQHEAELLREAHIGDIAFGVGPVPAHLLLPYVMSEISRDHPHLNITAEVQSALRLMEWLLEERIEFFVADTTQFIPSADIHYEPLLFLPAGLFVRKDHPLAGKPIKPKAFLDFTLASPGFSSSTDSSLTPPNLSADEPSGELQQLLATRNGHIVCENVKVLETVALSSDAVLLMSSLAIQESLNQGEMVPLCTRKGPMQWPSTQSVVRLNGRTLSPAAEKVIALMLSYGQSLAGNK
jgi:DNA-binding transcriptional LysR family regulator